MVAVLEKPRKKPGRQKVQAMPRTSKPLPPAFHPAELEFVDPARLDAINAIHRRRAPLLLQVAGEDIEVETGSGVDGAPSIDMRRVGFTIDGVAGSLDLPEALVLAWLRGIDADIDAHRLPPEIAALLIEAAVAPELEWLERRLDGKIELTATGPVDLGLDVQPVHFAIRYDNETFGAVLVLEDIFAARVGSLLDGLAPAPLPTGLEVPVRLLRAAATITLGELDALAGGDVVMFEDDPGYADACWAIIGGRIVVPVDAGGGECRPIAGPRPVRGSKWEWIMEQQGGSPDNSDVDDASVDELPVTLAFELGRTTMAVADIRRLGPGSVLPIAGLTSETVDILASGKRIGSGQIVRIGDGIGVRVTRLFDKHA